MRQYEVAYAGFSMIGLIRGNHEDNLYADGVILPEINQGLSAPVSGVHRADSRLLFGVFDGMGGESAGETAAYLAARTMKRLVSQDSEDSAETAWIRSVLRFSDTYGHFGEGGDYLEELCLKMNRSVCAYAEEHHVMNMGSTAACLSFAPDAVCSMNVGDSRIYRMSRDTLQQISEDHTRHSCFSRKGALLQYLGIPET